MDSPIKKFEKETALKLKEFDNRIKTSFILIRQDVDESKNLIDAMRKFLKKKDKREKYSRKEDNALRDKFRTEVDDFSQKISQLKLALDSVRKLKKEVVTKKDLARIEERIKVSFRNDIEDYKEELNNMKNDYKELEKRISALENGCVKEKKHRISILKSLKVAKNTQENSEE
jgi:exonuclease VII large subunit